MKNNNSDDCIPLYLASVLLILNIIAFNKIKQIKTWHMRHRFIDHPLFALIVVYFLCYNDYNTAAYIIAILGSVNLIYLEIYMLLFITAGTVFNPIISNE